VYLGSQRRFWSDKWFLELAQCRAKRPQINLAAKRLVTVDDPVRAPAETDAVGR
jgi:hypothetical protein